MKGFAGLVCTGSIVLAAAASALASVHFYPDESASGCADLGSGGVVLLAGVVSFGLFLMKSRR